MTEGIGPATPAGRLASAVSALLGIECRSVEQHVVPMRDLARALQFVDHQVRFARNERSHALIARGLHSVAAGMSHMEMVEER